MNKESTRYLGINIGGTQSSVSIGDEEGRMLDTFEWPTQAQRGYKDTLGEIAENACRMADKHHVAAAGVAIGGPLDTASGTVLGPPNLPGWDDVPLRDTLQKRLGLPTRVEHDAAACALAEYRFGKLDGASNLVYLTCGTGFGAGIVIDGKIFYGANGRHPEIGHWGILEGGPKAFGKSGSAEAVCSGKGLKRLASWLFPERWQKNVPTERTIVALAQTGDTDALKVVRFHAERTGELCAKVAEMLCPDCIVLGSLARHIGTLWVEPVQSSYTKEVLDRIGQTTRVIPSTLGERLQDLSALAVAMQ